MLGPYPRIAPAIYGDIEYTRRHSVRLVRRDSENRNLVLIIILAVIAGLTLAICLLVLLAKRRRRRQRRGNKTTDQSPGFFDSISRYWRSDSGRYEQTWGDDTNTDGQAQSHRLDVAPSPSSRAARTHQSRGAAGGGTDASTAQSATAGGAVDRNTSVRSVMTLPAYRQTASTNEQVLGREGDRDGVDVIIDLPTAEEEEALREEEMATIYQIRQTRRQQIVEREDLRQQRREARRRNDSGALADLRVRSRAASNNSQIDELRREVGRIQDTRQRSVSSVSYADLGVARHDGTRLRASSNDSERMGLLSDAASIAVSQRSGAPSPSLHRREQSIGSFVSVESDVPPSIRAQSRGGSRPDTPRLSGVSGTLAGSSPELVEADLGDEEMPPPEYEDVALDDTDNLGRSTTPLHGPPPDYPGPYRSPSVRSEHMPANAEAVAQEGEGEAPAAGRGVGGVPQLPSLRISRLPEIVIEPSSAHPHAGASR
ncbi:growth arrest and DNA-damage-inducible proteins-interacting protein 1 domain-containing protein [Purpureocillium lilacinum]|uniref:Growth arrest and DNA-damage-inducible proteins-interacting protein 1 domain-containing protein n=1 Tax=Purpureocillium lilacinum TaxID=33203 RepID=A0A179H098_PURLI|nr:growth arrest and DNA-damage-inducible proteins-interacting protein 1 domain-containing protein [Purpureocillium lilacinum]OAQ75989.1 growth arrest and DNA-damage-inducible proteins-interacting protein 1 domain-containing protein [Purpureocillium lilacinum]OAQ83138.1 growth arrest and DNA-damage-inducible proteins-interacting protein 1 domain-containing protein [Purpureocillium lilacinum]GJN79330.1 hypothetical protein PLIIFM63780_002843 [Purpureocillium lilacinum]